MKKMVIFGAPIIGAIFVLPMLLIAPFLLISVAAAEQAAATETETVETLTSTANGKKAGSCAPDCEGEDGPQDFDPQVMLAAGLAEVGTSRSTGYNAPGECIVSVRRWITAAGGHFASGGVVTGYVNSPAMQVTDGSLRPGDVVQYQYIADPDSFIILGPTQSVHTYAVLAVNEDGTHDILESNVPAGSGLVGIRENQHLEAPPGYEVVVWRFTKTPNIETDARASDPELNKSSNNSVKGLS